ncbi:MAG: VTT domain-containing protein, partial [Candidatus Lightella neohaematopini]|nr:VTT domain-containing protein [Candidatus Lightella neohaematopini]
SLTIAAWLGSWVSFLQGKWLKNKKLVNYRFLFIPKKYQKKAYKILNNYGSLALLIGRFIIFIRTVLPMIIGLSNIHNKLFQLFNFFSAFFWVSTLIFVGYLLNILIINISLKYLITILLTIVPIIIFIISLIIIVLITLRKK